MREIELRQDDDVGLGRELRRVGPCFPQQQLVGPLRVRTVHRDEHGDQSRALHVLEELEAQPLAQVRALDDAGNVRGDECPMVGQGDHTEVDDSGTRHEELFFVASGRAAFTVGGETVDAPAGTFVYVPDPAVVRGATALEPGTTLVAVGGEPGKAFEISPWEREYADGE